MLNYFLNFITETFRILADTSIYLLFGFLIAGLLHVYFPRRKIKQYFGKKDVNSVLNASLFGVPLPLCSCSVIPTAIAMRKGGASRGAVFSFLISTPETSVPSIGISFALLDPLMTIFRPVAAFITAMLTGLGINLIDRDGNDDRDIELSEDDQCDITSHHHKISTADEDDTAESHYQKIRRALQYSFSELFDDMATWLVIGIFAAGAIAALIPDSFFAGFLGHGFLPMLLMLLIGIPLYICATGSTPVAAALILKGLSPGAAFVFLLAGPATNISSLIVLSKYFPRRIIAFYLGSIAVTSLIMGGILNAFYSYFNLSVSATLGKGASLIPGWMKIGALIIVAVMLHQSMLKQGQYRKFWNWLKGITGWTSKKLAWVLAVVFLLIYLSDGLFVVPAGNTGMSVVFGNVVRSDLAPGLYYRPPVPIGKTVLVPTDSVRSVAIGFRRMGIEQASSVGISSSYLPLVGEKLDKLVTRDVPEESELLAGDENLITINLTVHYSITDAFQATYRIKDIDEVMRELTTYHVLEEIATRHVSDELTGERLSFERRVMKGLRETLDSLGIGVKIHDVNLIYSHAPDVVHPAFRDVASAMEDKYRLMNLAETDSVSKVADAQAKVARKLASARSDSVQKVDQATGESNRLLAIAKATRIRSEEQRFRMNAEAAESTLVNIDKILMLTSGNEGLDLILIPQGTGTLNNLSPEVLQRLQNQGSSP